MDDPFIGGSRPQYPAYNQAQFGPPVFGSGVPPAPVLHHGHWPPQMFEQTYTQPVYTPQPAFASQFANQGYLTSPATQRYGEATNNFSSNERQHSQSDMRSRATSILSMTMMNSPRPTIAVPLFAKRNAIGQPIPPSFVIEQKDNAGVLRIFQASFRNDFQFPVN